MTIIYTEYDLENVLDQLKKKVEGFSNATTLGDAVLELRKLSMDEEHAMLRESLANMLRSLSINYIEKEAELIKEAMQSGKEDLERSFKLIIDTVAEVLPSYDMSWYSSKVGDRKVA